MAFKRPVAVLNILLCCVLLTFPLIGAAQPSSKSIANVIKREKSGTIEDCYYINQLFKECQNVDQVQDLKKFLRSEFQAPNQKTRTIIAAARRLSFLGMHRSAIQLLRSLSNDNFNKLNRTLKSEYYHALGYISLNSGNPDISLEYYQKAASYSKHSDNLELNSPTKIN